VTSGPVKTGCTPGAEGEVGLREGVDAYAGLLEAISHFAWEDASTGTRPDGIYIRRSTMAPEDDPAVLPDEEYAL
jgi:hypothetical protein